MYPDLETNRPYRWRDRRKKRDLPSPGNAKRSFSRDIIPRDETIFYACGIPMMPTEEIKIVSRCKQTHKQIKSKFIQKFIFKDIDTVLHEDKINFLFPFNIEENPEL